MKIHIPRKLFYFIVFGYLGITTEIFFTAGYSIAEALMNNTPINWRLQGVSYVWMFPIYGSAGVLLPLFINYILRFPLLLRLIIYTVGIFIIEFLSGWILDLTTGQCPWFYYSKWSIPGFNNPEIPGYIHLAYTPFWMGFGLILETVYRFLESVQSSHVQAK